MGWLALTARYFRARGTQNQPFRPARAIRHSRNAGFESLRAPAGSGFSAISNLPNASVT
jgi:hypothetical protein